MQERLISLTIASNKEQRAAIERILRRAGVPFEQGESAEANALFGQPGGGRLVEFLVPESSLKPARAALREEGVVCEVTALLSERALHDIVQPLLSGAEHDFGKLLRYLELSAEDTLSLLFASVLRRKGGAELLEELFFLAARRGVSSLRVLASALSARTTASFIDRYQSDVSVGEDDQRVALLRALPEFASSAWHRRALALGLLDRSARIREAASEALYALHGQDCGYDPEDPPAEREAAVQELLQAADRA